MKIVMHTIITIDEYHQFQKKYQEEEQLIIIR